MIIPYQISELGCRFRKSQQLHIWPQLFPENGIGKLAPEISLINYGLFNKGGRLLSRSSIYDGTKIYLKVATVPLPE